MRALSTLRQTVFDDENDLADLPLGDDAGPQNADVQYSWIFCPVTARRGNGGRDVKIAHDAEMRTGAALAVRNSQIGVCRIYAPNRRKGMSASFSREDAYLVGTLLQDCPRARYWENGKEAPVCDLRAGDAVISDLKRDPRVLIDKPVHAIYFFMPRIAFDIISDEMGAPRIGDLVYRPGAGIADETIASLARSLLPIFARPEEPNGLFVRHVSFAMAAHVARTYGRLKPAHFRSKGGLAPWQIRRAQEFLNANLDGRVSVKRVAQECALSVSHFSRAFRETTGDTPHRWLLKRRVDAAKTLMHDGNPHLAEVAVACGFSDQSHLARVFTRETGMSPSVWRRWQRE
jgi:AraC-like DNA-binding protein